jgi:hypothetical protein
LEEARQHPAAACLTRSTTSQRRFDCSFTPNMARGIAVLRAQASSESDDEAEPPPSANN